MEQSNKNISTPSGHPEEHIRGMKPEGVLHPTPISDEEILNSPELMRQMKESINTDRNELIPWVDLSAPTKKETGTNKEGGK